MEIVEICEKLSQQGRQVSDDAALNSNRVHKKTFCFAQHSKTVPNRLKNEQKIPFLWTS